MILQKHVAVVEQFLETCSDLCVSDTDECLDFPCSQTCENFPGGYRCLCNRGFTLDNEGNCKGT